MLIMLKGVFPPKGQKEIYDFGLALVADRLCEGACWPGAGGVSGVTVGHRIALCQVEIMKISCQLGIHQQLS